MKPLMVLLSVIGCMLSRPVGADPVEDFKRLVAAKSLRCVFASGSIADWKSGHPEIKADHKGVGVTHFDSIDYKSKTARLIGNLGASDVGAFVTAAGVHFIEQTPVGGLVVTSVFPSRAAGELVGVTSRHIDLGDGGPPLPSQYHGTCRIWEGGR